MNEYMSDYAQIISELIVRQQDYQGQSDFFGEKNVLSFRTNYCGTAWRPFLQICPND